MSNSKSHESSGKGIDGVQRNPFKVGLSTIKSEDIVEGRSLRDGPRKGKKWEERENSKNSVDLTKPMDPNTYSKKSSSSSDLPRFVEGQQVHLLSDDDENVRVARGRVAATIRPTDEVGGTKLGKRFVGVCVEEIIEPDEELIRPYAQYRIIGDAGSAIIAWQKKHLQLI